MKRCVAILLLGLVLQQAALAQEPFSIYLVRHAEKATGADPELTACGKERATRLATFLELVDVEVIYSTDYVRTRATAQPTAVARGLSITPYNARALKEFSMQLIDAGQNALVVGHSNTTGVLAEMLMGEDIPTMAIADDVYDRIYEVVIVGDEKVLKVFQTTLDCQ